MLTPQLRLYIAHLLAPRMPTINFYFVSPSFIVFGVYPACLARIQVQRFCFCYH